MSSMTQSSRVGIAAQAKEDLITAMKFLLKMGYSEREYDNLAIEISDEVFSVESTIPEPDHIQVFIVPTTIGSNAVHETEEFLIEKGTILATGLTAYAHNIGGFFTSVDASNIITDDFVTIQGKIKIIQSEPLIFTIIDAKCLINNTETIDEDGEADEDKTTEDDPSNTNKPVAGPSSDHEIVTPTTTEKKKRTNKKVRSRQHKPKSGEEDFNFDNMVHSGTKSKSNTAPEN